MHAAVVTSFGEPPSYQEFSTPEPTRETEVLVDVLAAGLHPRVRSQADGSHYTSSGDLPLVPGIDGVGRGADGALRYFVLPDTSMGSMADQTVVDLRRSVVLPENSDPVTVAAAMNPAMSSWVALRQRVETVAGQQVLILGATGNAGRMAVQIARHLGARHVIGTGRGPRLDELAGLGADRVVALDDDPEQVRRVLADAASEVDVVLDYLWGEPTVAAMTAIATARRDEAKPLTWVQIGSVAGLTAAIPSAALRAIRLSVVGSGQGSVRTRDILAELPELAAYLGSGDLRVDAEPMPLAEVTRAWELARTCKSRVVLVP